MQKGNNTFAMTCSLQQNGPFYIFMVSKSFPKGNRPKNLNVIWLIALLYAKDVLNMKGHAKLWSLFNMLQAIAL